MANGPKCSVVLPSASERSERRDSQIRRRAGIAKVIDSMTAREARTLGEKGTPN
jgi:hypothetical protein